MLFPHDEVHSAVLKWQLPLHDSVPAEYPSETQVAVLRSEPSHCSLVSALLLPHTDVQALVSKPQLPLQASVPAE